MRGEVRYRMIVSASSENNAVFYLTEECMRWPDITPDLDAVHVWCRENGLVVENFMNYLTMSANDALVFRLRWC
ncbi:MAG: hypothetical protein EOP83_31075 [Verrucomicrobiaceae bacterium]|nr:MAG: hypothetical protein EOP83_31075 [Verrucomicrobiaceae bacterium]